jgi:hypothetical protein
MLCRIYCLWIVMMAHKSKKKNFSSLSSSGLICVFLAWKSLSCCHRTLMFVLKIYAVILLSIIHHIYINVYAYVHQSHLIAHSFCFYWRELHDASLCPIDDEVLLSFIHKWSVCVTKQRRRDRESHQKMWWYAS